ncbi:MAG: hypothetical protein ACAI25_14905 [Planctomycetota bacterium]
MSPDSFLIDPFLLFADGLVLALLWERHWKARFSKALPFGIAAAILVIFYSVSISLWFNLAWVDGFAQAMPRAETGRDWMLNSGVFHFEHATPSRAARIFSACFFATYPGWLALGAHAGARIWARPPIGH